MSLKSAPYYWIECDHPGCGTRSTEDSDYAAWADHGSAYDEATSRDWYCPSGGPDLCEEHAPPFCCNCSEVATTEHEGDDYCDDCLADELAPDIYEVAEQRIAAPDRSFIPAEDVIIETAPGKCPHGVDPDWCDACFDVAIAQPAPEEPLMTGELVTACAPSGCSCAGHHMPGVRHIVPCCDKPHIDQNDHIALLDGLLTAPEEDR